jgi:hypothetical protein
MIIQGRQMFKNKLFWLGLVLISILLLGSCDLSEDEEIRVSFGQEFVLPIGHTAVFDSKDLKIKFESVSSDSRCPKGVTCVWAGEAKCQTLVGNDRSFSSLDLVDTGGTTGYTQINYQNSAYNLKLSFKLEPYPEKDKQINKNDYKLSLTVSQMD